MRRFFGVLSTAFFLLISAGVAYAAPGETIIAFDTTITPHKDRSITVVEEITYDFGSGERHGIFRDLPFATRNGLFRSDTPLAVESILRDGSAEPFVVESNGLRKRIRIGDADRTITGAHLYTLTYRMQDVIRRLDDGNDELAWNVTGNEWDVPIERSSAVISLSDITAKPLRSACYTGGAGSKAHDCTIDATLTRFSSDVLLNEEDGLTVAAAWAPDVFGAPAGFGKFLKENYYLFFPVIVFVWMFIRFLRHGRDRKLGVIIAQYDPPNDFSAPEAGTIIDQKVERRDVAAGILELATRGFATMRFDADGSITVVKASGKPGAVLPPVLKTLYDGLFASESEVDLGDMKGAFLKSYQAVEQELYTSLTDRGYFVKNPNAVRKKYAGWGTLLIIAGVIIGFIRLTNGLTGIEYFWPLVGSGVIITLFGAQMPKFTKEGQALREYAEGFKLFLSVTETERLKFHNAPEKKPEQFMAFLPFAMAFGVEKQWAEQFKDMNIAQPSWTSGNWVLFSPSTFADQVGHVTRELGGAITTPSSSGSGFSGGGGSSGGGFGGGGGGSW